ARCSTRTAATSDRDGLDLAARAERVARRPEVRDAVDRLDLAAYPDRVVDPENRPDADVVGTERGGLQNPVADDGSGRTDDRGEAVQERPVADPLLQRPGTEVAAEQAASRRAQSPGSRRCKRGVDAAELARRIGRDRERLRGSFRALVERGLAVADSDDPE